MPLRFFFIVRLPKLQDGSHWETKAECESESNIKTGINASGEPAQHQPFGNGRLRDSPHWS
jgi:hypothetical protein